MNLNRFYFFAVLSGMLLASCGSSKKVIATDYLYFRTGSDTVSARQRETVIQPNDLLSIQVYSKTSNQDQAAIFNIPPISSPGMSPMATSGNAGISGSSAMAGGSSFLYQPGYQVSDSGMVDYPVFGPLKVAGLTIEQLQNMLLLKLSNYVKSPAVMIRFLEFNVDVLGEVRTPGTHRFYVNRVTVLDAISAAGDLTDFGKRENIMVIREIEGKKIYYALDLRGKAIFESPAYILEPNDIVYVSPNKYKTRNLSINLEERQRKTGLVFGIVSILISLATLIYLISTKQ